VVDPVTGNPAMSLPIDVVESAAVIANPYDPEYGRFAGAVSTLQTTSSNFNDFHFSVQNLFARPRRRDGDFIGIESATPRATFTGPLIKNKVAFTESFEYRFVRTPVNSLPPLERDMKFEGMTWFTQVDVNLNSRQSVTATFTLYPQKLNYLGLNTFAPQSSTPDLHQRGYMGSLQHRLAINADSLLLSQFTYKQFDADVTPNSTDPYQLLVETTTGGFFDRQARKSEHSEWQEIYQRERRGLAGSHQLKFGLDYVHDKYDGRITMLPVTIVGVSNLPIEQIKFGPAAQFGINQDAVAWFIGDKWQPIQRLTIDLGLRFDHDSITHDVNTAPRAGFALMLTKDAKTVLKGGAGLFYDRVPLNVASFPLLPGRTVAMLSPAGSIVSSQSFVNGAPGGLRNPRSIGWNIELDRQLTSALVVRAGFQQRNTARDFVLDPRASLDLMSLSNTGRSFYREFQFTAQYKVQRGTLNASYVRSKAFGNLNDFNQFFGNYPNPVINPDGRGRLSWDAPNRFLAWGQFEAPFKFTVLPVLDLHTGFPYSVIDQAREFVGPRNSERFPRFASLDLQVTRPIPLPFTEKVKARVGFSVFNLLNRFNPRDVQSDIDSDRFGAMFNGVGRFFRGKFVLEF
jgi:outer membrane receptor protein involved in Fe transport